ncbi:hypothetical protein CK203_109349 [Vitis vinifera]|uniref:PGG domain-containing protein n=1 Tax=Vitis vinifera TaxID=29760 RepID=A0A438FH97_VITVI|nr:hypothetical protein CK203_109349 [Vitis vinifera]
MDEGTAKFYTLAAALIATVVFAAAITIPGGTMMIPAYQISPKKLPSKFLRFRMLFPSSFPLLRR